MKCWPMLLLFSTTSLAGLDNKAQKQIQSWLGKHGKNVSFSYRDASGEFQVNGRELLAPASVAKVVSTGCALSELGPNFQFSTDFAMTGAIKNETLEGDLLISGQGDPGFLIEDLREVLSKIRYLHNIREIKGKVIFDVSYLGARELPIADGFGGDQGRAFAAPLTATPINANAFSIWTSADPRGSGSRSEVFPFQSMDLILNNSVKLEKAFKSTETSVSYEQAQKKAVVSGRTGSEADPKGWYRSVDDPYQYFFNQIKQTWTELGGTWNVPTFLVELSSKNSTKVLWKHQSRPLSKVLMDVNKFSLNFGAEMVWLAAGAKKYGRPATAEKSRNLVQNCLASMSINKDELQLENASGLSRKSRLQSSALSQFLMKMQEQAYFPEYLASLSVMGVDGTTRRRLTDRAGKARLKTGSIKNVESLVGYVKLPAPSGWAAFSLIINGSATSDGDRLENNILELLTR